MSEAQKDEYLKKLLDKEPDAAAGSEDPSDSEDEVWFPSDYENYEQDTRDRETPKPKEEVEDDDDEDNEEEGDDGKNTSTSNPWYQYISSRFYDSQVSMTIKSARRARGMKKLHLLLIYGGC